MFQFNGGSLVSDLSPVSEAIGGIFAEKKANKKAELAKQEAAEAQGLINEEAKGIISSSEAGDQVDLSKLLELNQKDPKTAQFLGALIQRNDTKRLAEIQQKQSNEFKSVSGILNLPVEKRKTAFSLAAQEKAKAGGDISQELETLNLSDDEFEARLLNKQLKLGDFGQLFKVGALSSGKGDADKPTDVKSFEFLSKGLSDEDNLKARRIKLRLDQGAGTTTFAEKLATNEGLQDQVAESKANISDRETRAKESAVSSNKATDSAIKTIGAISASFSNIDRAVELLDKEGANTGAISNLLPSLKASTLELKQLQNKFGLDLISSVSFGALSESELNLALNTALNLNLPPKDLKNMLVSQKAAQQKLVGHLKEQVEFLKTGTPAEWIAEAEKRKASRDSAVSTESITLPNGVIVRRVK